MNVLKRKYMLLFYLSFFIINVIINATASSPSVISDLTLKLSTSTSDSSEVGSDDDAIIVDFSVTNNTTKDIRFLKWGTPFETNFNANNFIVKKNGQVIDYIGRTVKRASPQKSDYIDIAAGEMLSASIDLAKGYAMYAKGNYSVVFRDVINKSLVMTKGVEKYTYSNTINLDLAVERKAAVFKQPPDFSSCSSSQRSQLNNALLAAENIAKTAKDDLHNTPSSQRSSAERYKKWFGSYTSSRYSTVTTHFDNIYNTLRNKTVHFHCDCTESYFAYVFSSRPYDIWLCNAFWNASLTGTDSRAGTLVHESSHFTVVADTDDHAYGHNAASNLAINNPTKAISNADSHEYFAENTPTLTMGTGGSTSFPGWSYCSSSNRCSAGYGDCDSDSECRSGLVCSSDVGANYGWPNAADVCEVSNALQVGDWDYCSSTNRCSVNQGDCDANNECQSGLVCVDDVGASYGWASAVDVCQVPRSQPGDWDYCSSTNRCGNNEGDCDSNSECQTGLDCVHDIGANYGWSSAVDVCRTRAVLAK